ncbi:EF-hand domain-containing protein [Agrilutibacter solisilvae]|uniref:EF-hand domain-containing protein n=1 Tax=Agrilutibacter solisilvae TaxID=2763317 RepID=A0A975AT79_9GAMM|nr:EF-hand domain-containing protein [Lysobacter solisilvae]QSX79537.1 hypothetical protein I8J32_006705 [Lysobacter solisilvae]
MKTRNRNLLTIALATALLSPAAWAEKGGNQGAGQVVRDTARTTGSTVSDTVRDTDQAARDSANQAGKTVSETAREANATTQDTTTRTMNDASTDEPKTKPERTASERMVNNPTNTETEDMEKPTSPVPPTQSQGAANAQAHASVTQRELWGRLDTDHDGQISAAESQVDAEFNAGFQAMDTNDDGLLTDAEYQVAARADIGGAAQGGVNAASHSAVSVRDLMGRLDANADGSISATEGQADAGFTSSFSTIDANSDGMVSSDEYRAWSKDQRK